MKTTAAALLLLALTSCGTMFGQGGGDLMVSSKPKGASITLDGKLVGETPQQIHVAQSAKGRVTVALAGYVTESRKIGTTFNGPALLNVFLGYFGLVGIAIDAASGNVTNWDEAGMFFQLKEDK